LPRRSTLFPYTTLFRSARRACGGVRAAQRGCRTQGDHGAVRATPADPRRGAAEADHARRLERQFSLVLEGRADAVFPQREGRLRSEEHTSELQSRENLV